MLAVTLLFLVPTVSVGQSVPPPIRPTPYQRVRQGGVSRPQRGALNFTGATVTDDPVNGQTTVAVTSGSSSVTIGTAAPLTGGATGDTFTLACPTCATTSSSLPASSFQPLASDPGGPAANTVWWNTGTSLFKLYSGAGAVVAGERSLSLLSELAGTHAVRLGIRSSNTGASLSTTGVGSLYLGFDPDVTNSAYGTALNLGGVGVSSLDTSVTLLRGGSVPMLVGAAGGGDTGCVACGPGGVRENFMGWYGSRPSTTWGASTSYASGANVVNGPNTYEATQAGSCTSAASGGPTGTGTGISDGTCVWSFARVEGVAHPTGTPWFSIAKDADTRMFWGAGRWDGGATFTPYGDATGFQQNGALSGLHQFTCAAAAGTNPGCTISWTAGAASGANQNGGGVSLDGSAATGSGAPGFVNVGTTVGGTAAVGIGNSGSTTTVAGTLVASGSTQAQAVQVGGPLTFSGGGVLGSSLNPDTANSRRIGSTAVPLLGVHASSSEGFVVHGDLINSARLTIDYVPASGLARLTGDNRAILQASTSVALSSALIQFTPAAGGYTQAINNSGSQYGWRVLDNGSTVRMGFFNAAPVVQPSATGETVGFTAGSGTPVNDDSCFTGNVGATCYRVSDVVKALKQLGALAQ